MNISEQSLENINQAKERWRLWWKGEDLGRPLIKATIRNLEKMEPYRGPMPPVYSQIYTSKSIDYRRFLSLEQHKTTQYLIDALPIASSHMGPCSLALYLGCEGVEEKSTVWIEPCIKDIEQFDFEFKQDNKYWVFQLELIKTLKQCFGNEANITCPDMIEGLDILASMRGSEVLLFDLIDQPDRVLECLEKINRLYLEYYAVVYDLIKDPTGGMYYWLYGPGKMAKLQCDISAMISRSMFDQFMIPTLKTLSEALDYSIYHLDGPAAIMHLDSVLSIPGIQVIQWSPGAGEAPVYDSKWFEMYHKILEQDRCIYVDQIPDIETLQRFKKEFGKTFNRFVIDMPLNHPNEVDQILAQF